MQISSDRSSAEARDREDPLASYRQRFYLPQDEHGTPLIYFCGNSLGLQPRSTPAYVEQELEAWQTLGVRGHFEGRDPWVDYHAFLTEPMARVVGAKPEEVVVMNTLTANLHLMMVSFYRPTPQRYKIMIEEHAFPSDQYAVASQAAYHGYDPAEAVIKLRPRAGEHTLRPADIAAQIREAGESLALVLLPGVQYYSGQVMAMAQLIPTVHEVGAVAGLDLAHAVGNVPLALHHWGPDFAVWCNYKYMCGGPGAIGGCFVHERHAQAERPRFAGWWGQKRENRFQMGDRFEPMPGAEGWQLSNPPIMALAAQRAALDLFDAIGMDRLRQKSEQLTGYLASLLAQPGFENLEIITPAEPAERGCQLSLVVHGRGREVFDRISQAGVVCDWREPNVIRVAPKPLYNTFEEVHRFAALLHEAISAPKHA
jgi:kynureninase